MNIRIGLGVDYHRLVEGRPFVLGGVTIPHHKGADGHSDADVLLHAICDAILGAANLGDIGLHFPDTDAAYKDVDSKVLLRRCSNLVKEHGYYIVNIDSTVTLETPKLRPHIEKMQRAIAEVLGIHRDCISIKATTAEKLGAIGREEGVHAQAVVLLNKF